MKIIQQNSVVRWASENMDRFIKLLVVSSLLYGLCESKVSESLKVTLSHGGGVIGSYQTSLKGRGIRAFKGIPYAEPPVGELRFSDPVEKSGWTGYIKGEKGQAFCPQIDGMITHAYAGDEDCLYLSVYVPQFPETTEPLPVMVFIHGGGYVSGSGPMYQPQFILDHDVILVIGNYRLGPLGFMSTFTEEMRGNYGIKDQVEQLKWIQKNIGIFGGDPSKVTIFGESAGGGMVSHLLTTPLAKGLFQRAIVQSGTLYDAWGTIDQNLAEKNAKKMFSYVGCPYTETNVTEAVKCIKTKTSKDIIEQTMKLNIWDMFPMIQFGPVIEPTSFKNPVLNRELFDIGPDPSIPTMIGITANEAAIILAMISTTQQKVDDFQANFDKILPALAWHYNLDEDKKDERTKELKDFYLDGKTFNWETDHPALNDLISDSWFLQGFIKFLDQRFKQNQNNTFVYLFNYLGEVATTGLFNSDSNYGVSHADDLVYLFPFANMVLPHRAPSIRDQQFRDFFTKVWVDFAVSGSHSTELGWTPATKFPVDYLRFGERDQGAGIGMESGLFTKRAEFWKQMDI